MIFNYKEEEQLKNKDNKTKYYKQVKPFIIGVSSNITINLFEEVKKQWN